MAKSTRSGSQQRSGRNAGANKKNKDDGGATDKKFYDSMRGDFANAQEILAALGLDKPLERIDTSKEEALADPNSPAYAGRRSQEMQDVIALMKQGLAGLSAPENQALREQAQRSLDTQFQTMARQSELARAKSGVRGAATMAQLENAERARAGSQSQLEQDLLVKNIDIQDKRRGEFANTVSGAEAAEWGRGKDAMGMLTDKQKVNLGQANSDRASQLAALLGLTGYGLAKKTAQQSYQLARSGKGGQGGGGNDMSGLYDAVSRILTNSGKVSEEEVANV